MARWTISLARRLEANRKKANYMEHLTLENFVPTVSTGARTDIMRLLAHARGKEPVSEPLGRDLKPFERLPIGVCSSPAVPCTIKAPISVVNDEVKAGKWLPISTIAPPDLSATSGTYFTYHYVLGELGS